MTSFAYRGAELELFDHSYNGTRSNERAVELAVARAWLADVDGVGLEVGNVLGHYADAIPTPARRIVDRYEPGVEALDVFAIGGSFDWIVSISTLEHVRNGGGEHPNPRGAEAALVYLAGLLNPGGRMLVTVGLGQHPTLDDYLLARPDGVTLVRVRDTWCETSAPVALPYGPDHGANAVWIGEA